MPRAGAHALLTRPPLKPPPKERSPFDLHVLGAPPAFVLSQDQTLSFILFPDPSALQNSPPSSLAERQRQVKKNPPAVGGPFGITSANPQRPEGPAGPHRPPARLAPAGPQRPSAGQGLRTLKGNDELLPEPPTTPRLTATSASGMSGKNLASPSDAPRTSDPPSGRRPRIPSCLSIHHVKQQTPRNQAVAIRPRRSVSGTRYIDSSPARLKALFCGNLSR
jgi:hypothetical protein